MQAGVTAGGFEVSPRAAAILAWMQERGLTNPTATVAESEVREAKGDNPDTSKALRA